MSYTPLSDFWVVWNPNSRNPMHKHSNRAAAENEAARLAKENPDTIFYVLETVNACRSTTVQFARTPEIEEPF